MTVKIYLDLDGVLFDFDRALSERGISNRKYIHKPKGEWTQEEIDLDDQVTLCMNEKDWFYNLKVMPGAHELVETAHHLGQTWALTARPKNPEIAKDVERQKRQALSENFDGLFDNTTIVCLRSEKKNYAMTCKYIGRDRGVPLYDCTQKSVTPNILIDDMPWNISEWVEAGGIGILYKNSNQAIRELTSVFNYG